jgi:alcohol dehydrogenase (cytochrome c)
VFSPRHPVAVALKHMLCRAAHAGSGISQGAITFELDGTQYIAVVSGRLKTPSSFLGHTGERIFASSPESGALFVFELAD